MNIIRSTFLPLIASLLLALSNPLFADHPKGSESLSPLTESQQATFKELKQQMHAGKKDHKELHKQIHDLVFSENYSQKKLKNLIKDHQNKMLDQMLKNSTSMNEFYKSLNEEQRKALMRQCEEGKKDLLRDKKQCKEKHKKSLIEE